MRRLLLLLSLCISYTAFAQNYNCFTPGTRQYFVNSDTGGGYYYSRYVYVGGYLRGMNLDSVRQIGNTTVYYPFHTLRGRYGNGLPSLDSNGGSWLGKKVIQEPDGTFLFDNYWGDTVVIKTQANVGDTWMLYNDTTHWHYTGTIIYNGTTTVLGIVDSEKTIKITAYKNGNINTADPLNGLNIIITKNHGFAQVCDLYMFPMHKPDSVYAGGFYNDGHSFDYYTDQSTNSTPNIFNLTFSLITFHNPANYDNAFNAGDVFESIGANASVLSWYRIDSIMTRGIYSTYIEYQVHERVAQDVRINDTTRHQEFSMDYTMTTDSSLGFDTMALMPEDFKFRNGIMHYWPDDTGWCFKSNAYRIESDFIYGDNKGYQVNNFEPCGDLRMYKMGFIPDVAWGLCTDPGAYDNAYSQLIYAHKKGYPECGQYVSLGISNISNPLTEIKIFPNPVSDELSIKLPPDHIFKIAIVNSIGQAFYTNANGKNTEEIDMHNMPPGMYVVAIHDENGNSGNYKVVVQH